MDRGGLVSFGMESYFWHRRSGDPNPPQPLPPIGYHAPLLRPTPVGEERARENSRRLEQTWLQE